jgi:tRNA(adenine34) deaminase
VADAIAAEAVKYASMIREVPMPTKKKAAQPRKWSAKVHTESTYPPEGLFNKSAATIARTLASREVSPKGPGSGMRMLTFYINRAGHNLDQKQRTELEKAKQLLHQRVEREKGPKKRATARKKAA